MNPGTHVRYLGHSCFELVTSGTTIIIDPYQNEPGKYWFQEPFPRVRSDLVLVTHDHFDHNASKSVQGNPRIVTEVGTQRIGEFVIHGIAGHHARSKEYHFTENRVFIIEKGGVRFCHWGDNGAAPPPLGRVDVLFLPVDESEHILRLEEVAHLMEKLAPRIVIPMHYFIPLFTTKESTLQSIDQWLSRQRQVRKIPSTGVTILRDSLPQTQEVWVFEPFYKESLEG